MSSTSPEEKTENLVDVAIDSETPPASSQADSSEPPGTTPVDPEATGGVTDATITDATTETANSKWFQFNGNQLAAGYHLVRDTIHSSM